MIISIITPTYNSSATIKDTLESVKNQNFKEIEHIIIDGVSTDDTLKIVSEYPSVSRIISEPDKGIYDAMNKGIKTATGEIIGILNSDDIFASESILQTVAELFKNDINIDVIYGNILYFKGNQTGDSVRYWKSKPYYTSFFEDGEVPPHPAFICSINRNIFATFLSP